MAVHFRRPVAEVLSWPAAHVGLILAFLRVEPTPEDRIEQAIARLSAQHFNRTRGKDQSGQTEPARHVADFLPYATAWSDEGPAASTIDQQLSASLNRFPKE